MLLGFFRFNKILKAPEIHLPKRSVFAEPGIDRLQRSGIQFVDSVPSLATLAHQTRASQQPQMLRNSWPRNREGPCDLSGGLASLPQ